MIREQSTQKAIIRKIFLHRVLVVAIINLILGTLLFTRIESYAKWIIAGILVALDLSSLLYLKLQYSKITQALNLPFQNGLVLFQKHSAQIADTRAQWQTAFLRLGTSVDEQPMESRHDLEVEISLASGASQNLVETVQCKIYFENETPLLITNESLKLIALISGTLNDFRKPPR